MADALDSKLTRKLHNEEKLSFEREVKATSYTDNTRVVRDKHDKGDSRISSIITQSFLEKEKNYLKNPKDYDNISEVNLYLF